MRVAVSADDDSGLASVISPHFGRCPYYVLVDLDGREMRSVRTVENPYYGRHQPGQVPGFIKSEGADVMLAGGMGRRAIGLFREYGIEAMTGASGTVQHALDQYLNGTMQAAEPCRESLGHSHSEVTGKGPYGEHEVARLHEEIEMLQRQLTEAMERLDRLTAS